MKEKSLMLKNGYRITVQKINDVSHMIISDTNLYPDNDSRSSDYWRLNGGLLIPINDNKDLKKISKLFEL